MGGGYSGYRVGGLGRATRGAALLAGSGVCQLANFSAFQLFDLLGSWEVGKLAGWVGGGTAGCERVSVMNRNDTAGGSPAVAAELAGSSSFTPG